MFSESPREMYALVEQRVGPRQALYGFRVMFYGAVATALGAIGAVVYYATIKVVLPAVRALPEMPSIPGAGEVVLSAGISIALVTLAISLLVWRLFVWRNLMIRVFGSAVTRLEARADHLEQNSADFQSVHDNIAYLREQVENLETRPLLPPPRSEDDMNRIALMRLLGQPNATIKRSGPPPE